MISLVRRIAGWFAFTTAEQNVLFFLLGAFVLGSGIRLYQGTDSAEGTPARATADSAFAALSAFDDDVDEQPARVNINTASKADLVALPGIGEVTAERIIVYREEVGPFTSVDGLLAVKGISRKKLEQLNDLITVH